MRSLSSIIAFIATITLFFTLIDIYVLRRWSAYTKRNDLGVWYRRIPWIIAIVMFVLFVGGFIERAISGSRSLPGWLFATVAFWYFPKVAIAAILLIRDAVASVRWTGKKISTIATRKKSAPVKEPAPETSPSPKSRRDFLATTGWSLAAVPFASVGIGLIKTVYDFQIHREEVVIPNLPRAMDGFTVIQISDIHAGSFPDHVAFQEAKRLVDAEKADAIVITGDFVNFKPEELKVIYGDLSKFNAPAGVYGSLGNHDHYNSNAEHEALKKVIRDANIDLLVNERRRIGTGDASLIIAGTDNTGMRQDFADLDKTLVGLDGGEPTILMAHDPTFWDKEIVGNRKVDLMLSGHTHGGQFGVSIFGHHWSPAQYVYEQYAGMYVKGDQKLYVNRGLGTTGPPLRIGVPPEITLFTLRAPRLVDSMS